MTTISTDLPIDEIVSPADALETAAAVRDAHERALPVYPLGGRTSLDYGANASASGLGLSLANQTKVIDYPARDMTITVEAGITLAALAETLAAERQCLPVDVPNPRQATLGGLIATDWSGPRRFGYGTMRDYVIGISAVDGRGTPFRGGGRVVKNVAGYDFCKLLTGSLGTLGIITQVTLKVRPVPERSTLIVLPLESFDQAEELSSALVTSRTAPSAVELLSGPTWESLASPGPAALVVGLEGTGAEVEWMSNTLQTEWRSRGATGAKTISGSESTSAWNKLTEFTADPVAGLTLKCSVLPSKVVAFVSELQALFPQCSIQAHASSGIAKLRFGELAAQAAREVIHAVRQRAVARNGRAVVISSATGGLSAGEVWGPPEASYPVMQSIKQQLDPKGLLNPGRFVFSS